MLASMSQMAVIHLSFLLGAGFSSIPFQGLSGNVSNVLTADAPTTSTSMSQSFDSYALRVRSLAAQGKLSEAIELVNELIGKPKSELAEHDAEVAPIFLAGYEAALSLGNYLTAARFIETD